MDIRSCIICGAEFTPKSHNQVCCSQKCLTEKRKRSRRLVIGEIRYCKFCGKEFIYDAPKKTYCSPLCREIATRKNREKKKVIAERNKTPKLSILEINKRAEAEGLTYGEYVSKYNL